MTHGLANQTSTTQFSVVEVQYGNQSYDGTGRLFWPIYITDYISGEVITQDTNLTSHVSHLRELTLSAQKQEPSALQIEDMDPLGSHPHAAGDQG